VVKLSTAKSSAAKKNSSTVPTVKTISQVTGGRGTLKRRRQIQQLIAYSQQQLDIDNLFSSTPYRSNMPVNVLLFSFTAVLCFNESDSMPEVQLAYAVLSAVLILIQLLYSHLRHRTERHPPIRWKCSRPIAHGCSMSVTARYLKSTVNEPLVNTWSYRPMMPRHYDRWWMHITASSLSHACL